MSAAGLLIGIRSAKLHIHDPEVNPLAGHFTLSYNGKTTTDINYNDYSDTVYTKLTSELGLSSKSKPLFYLTNFSLSLSRLLWISIPWSRMAHHNVRWAKRISIHL